MTIRFVLLLTVILHLAFAGSRVTLSLFALHLQATPLTVGILISLLAAMPLLFAVGWGRTIDRIGVRKPLMIGAGAVLGALLLGAAVPRIEVLFIVSAIVGSGFMLVHICVNQVAGLLGTPEQRSRNFSLLALAFSTSGFLGPVISGFAIDLVGHRMTFLLLGCSAAAGIALMLLRPIRLPAHPASVAGQNHKRVGDLFRIRGLRRAFVASAVLSMAWDLFTFVTPIHGTRLGLSASVIGLILGCFGAAIFLVRLVLPAIVHRLKTGESTKVDIAMFDCQLALLENAIMRYTVEKEIPGPLGARHPTITPFEAFATSDGSMIIAAGNDSLFVKMCEALGRSDMATDPAYKSNALRQKSQKKLKDEIESVLRTNTTDHWIAVVSKGGVPCGPINNIAQALEHPQVAACNMLVEVPDGSGGTPPRQPCGGAAQRREHPHRQG